MKTTVTKASGELEPFRKGKLKASLLRSGVLTREATSITQTISQNIHDGDTTDTIHKQTLNILKKHDKSKASRYRLKHAIQELGPSGYPFEKFVGRLLEADGYKTEVGVVVNGFCVTHEIDVLAIKKEKHFMIECKFHNYHGTKSDVKVALYIHSRFQDVEKRWKQERGHSHKFHQAWLVTNTKFSKDAISYGECVGMHLVGWRYAHEGGLESLIEKSGLYPITGLFGLTTTEKKKLLDRGHVLCRDIAQDDAPLQDIGMSEMRRKKIKREAQKLCALFA